MDWQLYREMNKHKLAIIVPYRDREKQLNIFLPHMEKFLSRPAQEQRYGGTSAVDSEKLDYDIFVVEQMDDYPFNRGMLINSCVKMLPEEYDYLVFHDIDLLPMTDSIDYRYEEKPVHLISEVEGNKTLPYFEYIGGAFKIPRHIFEKINGFSNEYWGWGFEDLDFLLRMRESHLTELEHFYDTSNLTRNKIYDYVGVIPANVKMNRKFRSLKFDGNNYVKIHNNDRITNITHGSYSVSAWFNPQLTKDDKATKLEPISIVSRAGFHTGIQIVDISDTDVQVRCMGFTEDTADSVDDNFAIEFSVQINEWSHVCFVLNDKQKKIQVYLDGVEVDGTNQKITYENSLEFYDSSYFIGSSYEKTGNFKGLISEPCWFDYALNEQEVNLLYEKNPSEHSWTHFYDEPCMYFPFDQLYNNFVFDSSFTHSNGKIYCLENTEDLFVEQETILGTEIELPKRLNGKFKSLTKGKMKNIKQNMKWVNIDYFEDPDVQENYLFFNELVKDLKILSIEDGFSNLTFNLLDEKEYKNAKFMKVAL